MVVYPYKVSNLERKISTYTIDYVQSIKRSIRILSFNKVNKYLRISTWLVSYEMLFLKKYTCDLLEIWYYLNS